MKAAVTELSITVRMGLNLWPGNGQEELDSLLTALGKHMAYSSQSSQFFGQNL